VTAVDSSVVIAAFATWHEAHTTAVRVLAGRPRIPAACALETYAVLTSKHHGHELVTLDARARATYDRVGADVQYLGEPTR